MQMKTFTLSSVGFACSGLVSKKRVPSGALSDFQMAPSTISSKIPGRRSRVTRQASINSSMPSRINRSESCVDNEKKKISWALALVLTSPGHCHKAILSRKGKEVCASTKRNNLATLVTHWEDKKFVLKTKFSVSGPYGGVVEDDADKVPMGRLARWASHCPLSGTLSDSPSNLLAPIRKGRKKWLLLLFTLNRLSRCILMDRILRRMADWLEWLPNPVLVQTATS